ADFGFHGADLENQVDGGVLIDDQADAGANGVLETGFRGTNFVFADGKGNDEKAASFVGGDGAGDAGFRVADGDADTGYCGRGSVGHETAERGGDLSARTGAREQRRKKQRCGYGETSGSP